MFGVGATGGETPPELAAEDGRVTGIRYVSNQTLPYLQRRRLTLPKATVSLAQI